MTFASMSYSFCIIRCIAMYTNTAVRNQMTSTDTTAPRISYCNTKKYTFIYKKYTFEIIKCTDCSWPYILKVTGYNTLKCILTHTCTIKSKRSFVVCLFFCNIQCKHTYTKCPKIGKHVCCICHYCQTSCIDPTLIK
jgi:hypothetical protein